MKIIFLNTWNGKVREKIREFISKHRSDTDVYCFQEAYDQMRGLCLNVLQGFKLTNGYKYVAEGEDFLQATYYRDAISLRSQKTVLQDIPNVGLGLYTELFIGGKSINLCNVHGVAKPGNKLDTPQRLEQSQTLLDFFEDINGLKIIGGDFNLELATESITMFEARGYVNLIKKFGIKNTRNRFGWDRYPTSKQYYSDYVFVSPDVKVKRFEVSNDEISDHLAMILELDSNNI